MEYEEPVKIWELKNYCDETTNPDADILIYINDTPIGFMPESISYDLDGSIKLHIKDDLIKIKSEK